MNKYSTYTGILEYKNIKFTFIFDKKKLKLIPPEDKKHEVELWFWKEIKQGTYTLGDPVYIKDIIYGITNETKQKIIFIPAYNDVSRINSTLIIDIEYYIINKYNRETIDRITIKGPEITHIFPTTLALNKIDWKENGKINLSTKSFDETTTEKEFFYINNKKASIYFGISISSSYKTGESPMNLSSTMFIEFEPTNNYQFIVEVLNITKQFVQYLCYRRNISFSSIELSAPTPKGFHETFAKLYKTEENNSIEEYPLQKGKFIKYEYLKGNIGKIINDIASKQIYIEHIPKSYESGRHIDASRFVMITAGFEWEFKRNYPNGIEKSPQTLEAEKIVTNIINYLIKKYTGKTKEIFKHLKKLISTDNLASRIITYGCDYGDISNDFGNHLYQLNGEELKYNEMGKRLADQRNHFAHGDIDKEFIGLSLLDLIYLEYIIYIIQLRFYGVEDNKIKFAINDLFSCHLAL